MIFLPFRGILKIFALTTNFWLLPVLKREKSLGVTKSDHLIAHIQ